MIKFGAHNDFLNVRPAKRCDGFGNNVLPRLYVVLIGGKHEMLNKLQTVPCKRFDKVLINSSRLFRDQNGLAARKSVPGKTVSEKNPPNDSHTNQRSEARNGECKRRAAGKVLSRFHRKADSRDEKKNTHPFCRDPDYLRFEIQQFAQGVKIVVLRQGNEQTRNYSGKSAKFTDGARIPDSFDMIDDTTENAHRNDNQPVKQHRKRCDRSMRNYPSGRLGRRNIERAERDGLDRDALMCMCGKIAFGVVHNVITTTLPTGAPPSFDGRITNQR